MSRSSSKKGRPTVRRDPATYLPALQERRTILLAAAERWDESRSGAEVVVMAAALRMIVADSLLNRVLNEKRSVMFCDSAHELPPPLPGEIRFGAGGLTCITMTQADVWVAPLCSAIGPEEGVRWVRFKDWWTTSQPVQQGNLRCSREFLVRQAANTDGIHLDAYLDQEYAELSSAMRGATIGPSAQPLEGVAAASLRQIAWEVEQTLTRALG